MCLDIGPQAERYEAVSLFERDCQYFLRRAQ
jgi:hypothetical protein